MHQYFLSLLPDPSDQSIRLLLPVRPDPLGLEGQSNLPSLVIQLHSGLLDLAGQLILLDPQDRLGLEDR